MSRKKKRPVIRELPPSVIDIHVGGISAKLLVGHNLDQRFLFDQLLHLQEERGDHEATVYVPEGKDTWIVNVLPLNKITLVDPSAA